MTDSVDKNEELRKAAAEGNVDEVKKLLDGGMNVDSQNEYGMSPLMAAVCRSQKDTVDFLIKHGADVNLKNVHGRSSVSMADEEMRKVIFASVKEVKEKGRTPSKEIYQER